MREGIDHVTRRRSGLGITRFIFIFACHTSDRDAQSYNHTCRLVRAESVALQIVLCESAVANTPNTTGFITHRLHSFNERNAHLQLRRRSIGEIDTRLRRAGQELRARMQRPKTELAKQRTRVRVKRTLNPESLSERRPGQRRAGCNTLLQQWYNQQNVLLKGASANAGCAFNVSGILKQKTLASL